MSEVNEVPQSERVKSNLRENWQLLVLRVLTWVVLLPLLVAVYQRYNFIAAILFFGGAALLIEIVKFFFHHTDIGPDEANFYTESIEQPVSVNITQSDGKTLVETQSVDSELTHIIGIVGDTNLANFTGTVREVKPGEKRLLSRTDDTVTITNPETETTIDVDVSDTKIDLFEHDFKVVQYTPTKYSPRTGDTTYGEIV